MASVKGRVMRLWTEIGEFEKESGYNPWPKSSKGLSDYQVLEVIGRDAILDWLGVSEIRRTMVHRLRLGSHDDGGRFWDIAHPLDCADFPDCEWVEWGDYWRDVEPLPDGTYDWGDPEDAPKAREEA